jgi:hypothetical protein
MRAGISLKALSEKKVAMSEAQKLAHSQNTKSLREQRLSEDFMKSIEKTFPEAVYQPHRMPPRKVQIYIKKYLRAINLQDIRAEITTKPLECDSWNIHQPS